MTNPNRRYDIYLEDILISMTRIMEYIENMDFRKFKMNYMVVDAVVRNFEIIGEASKNIPEEIQIKNPEIPWKKMYGLRNLISHEYFGIDYEIIWEISTANLPTNLIDIKRIIAIERNDNNF